MAAPTDLTWQQFSNALVEIIGAHIIATSYQAATDIAPAEVIFTLSNDSLVIQKYLQNSQRGTIKALFQLLEAARIAQEKLNEGKPAGEKLAAFPAPTTGATTNGTVPITRSIASRAVLSSVTQIDGVTA